MMRDMVAATIALLTLLAPLAAAQEETKPEEKPAEGEQAWVDDCPPDRMCAYAGGEGEPKDEPTYSGDCGGEVCASDSPEALGPEDCIECSGPRDDTGSTCMDGQQENETCRDDVYYLDGPTRGPADGSCENCRGEEQEPINSHAPAEGEVAVQDETATQTNSVPAPAIALGLLAAAAVAILVIPGRK